MPEDNIENIEQVAEQIANKIYKRLEASVFKQGENLADSLTTKMSNAVAKATTDNLKKAGLTEEKLGAEEFDEVFFEILENVTSELGVMFLEGFSASWFFPVTVGE